MAVIVIVSSQVRQYLLRIKEKIGELKELPYPDSWKVEMDSRLMQAADHCLNLGETILFEGLINPRILHNRLTEFIMRHPGTSYSPAAMVNLKLILDDVGKTVEYILSIRRPNENARAMGAASLFSELERLAAAKTNIQSQIAAEKAKETPDAERLASLETVAKILDARIADTRNEKNAAREDKQIKSDWSQRIKEAFEELSHFTNLIDKERKALNFEYKISAIIVFVLIVLICVWLWCFYDALLCKELKFPHWYSIIPYYLPIPVLGGLLWVAIVQKNRANRNSITLSDKLFRIHYLEGLLKTSNTLSIDSSESISRTTSTIDTMLSSYLKQMETMEEHTHQFQLASEKNNVDTKALLETIKEIIKTKQ